MQQYYPKIAHVFLTLDSSTFPVPRLETFFKTSIQAESSKILFLGAVAGGGGLCGS